MKKFLALSLLCTLSAFAENAYQVCGTNSQTKVTACSPLPMDKDTAEINMQFLNQSMKDNGLDAAVKFKTRKFNKKDIAPSPSVLYPQEKQAPRPAVTPIPDQRV